MHRSICVLVVLLNFAFLTDSRAEQSTSGTNRVVTLPTPGTLKTPKNYYMEELLTLIFHKEHLKLELRYSDVRMNQSRITESLINGKLIDMAWLPFTSERGQQLTYVEVPLYKGLHGMRLLLINKQNAASFENITGLQQLKEKVAVQRHSWSEFRVFTANGLRVHGDLKYAGMMKAVATGMFDYFPRSVLTIGRELERSHYEQLIIAPKLALIYPHYVNYFISNRAQDLARIVTSGMNKAICDGSFERIFDRYYAHKLKDLDIDNRRFFELKIEGIELQSVTPCASEI